MRGVCPQGFNEVDKLLRENGICLALREKLLKDSGVATDTDYDNIVRNLLEKDLARGEGSRSGSGSGSRSGSRSGSNQRLELRDPPLDPPRDPQRDTPRDTPRDPPYPPIDPSRDKVEGAVTVQPLAEAVRGFKNYFLRLRPGRNHRNPWFAEYWEDLFSCRFPRSPPTPYNQHYNKTCTGHERIDPDSFEMEAQLQFVSDAVMAFAHAFKEIHLRLCGGRPGLCERMTKIDGDIIKAHLLKVKFTGLSGQDFQFLDNGDGPSRYRILNFRRDDVTGEYEWATVGFYRHGHLNIVSSRLPGGLTDSFVEASIWLTGTPQVDRPAPTGEVEPSSCQFRRSEPSHPRSVCSSKCGRRQYMDPIPGDPCCWACKNCLTYEYRPVDTRCEECPGGTVPSYNMTHCIPIPPVFLHYTDSIALVAMAFASLGILATTTTAIIFLKHNNTPVVKASGRELSFVLLAGIFLCYTMTFLLVSKPTKYVCGAQTVGIGFCFSVCYSAILTKTNRISRIFRAGKRTVKRPKFISPESQLVICASLVACQIIISLIWLLTSPPKAVSFFATRADHQLVCEAAIGFAYMIGFSYPIFLILVCTIYAIITRKIPEAFNESKYIGFTMYTTCIIWAAFVVIYLSTSHNIQVRLATMCFSISLSATVALICMFTPKLYIILLRPERNVRQSMMAKNMQLKLNSSAASGCLRVDSGTQSDG
ncbi:metabotropic glutamate receptor 4-like [Aplysia californica]|uniref:Metabotropic glutamate receptor 4-like n=1 Tax=Aplysia californica TaxID=6500 RepID=A0ABM1VTZ8_APLCA|nr:metabotropic glutamate receptor 4-like [Aplysia californica]